MNLKNYTVRVYIACKEVGLEDSKIKTTGDVKKQQLDLKIKIIAKKNSVKFSTLKKIYYGHTGL